MSCTLRAHSVPAWSRESSPCRECSPYTTPGRCAARRCSRAPRPSARRLTTDCSSITSLAKRGWSTPASSVAPWWRPPTWRRFAGRCRRLRSTSSPTERHGIFPPAPRAKTGSGIGVPQPLGLCAQHRGGAGICRRHFPLILREVPAATFHLVGANPGPKVQALASRTGIKLSANLPDLRSAVCSAQVYVCAIRHGTGLKSKMLEAMAMRMPIVAYHPGSTVGIDCVYGKHLLAAETPQEFAAHVVELLRHQR